MSLGVDTELWLAIAIVVAALALFAWHMISTTRRVGYLLSESRVPRRYLLLGLAIGLGVIYFTRR